MVAENSMLQIEKDLKESKDREKVFKKKWKSYTLEQKSWNNTFTETEEVFFIKNQELQSQHTY